MLYVKEKAKWYTEIWNQLTIWFIQLNDSTDRKIIVFHKEFQL